MSKKKIIIISCSVIAVIIAAVLGVLWFRSAHKNEETVTTEAVEVTTEQVTEATPEAEELPEEAPVVKAEDEGDNLYALSWNEVACDKYIIEYIAGDISEDVGGNWEEYKELEPEVTGIELGQLEPFKCYLFRVTAKSGSDTFESEEVRIETKESALYSTVWATRDMTLYKTSDGDEQLGTVPVLSSLCVLEEKDGRFLVKTDDGEGYIDSNYCMINLPDYMGELCRYDITNSYASWYTAHNAPIPNVSGTVITGYENVLLDDGTFLVPLLYPVAKKLVPAAETARDQGYVIKIYDSFRPYIATRDIYDTTSEALNYIVPNYSYTRVFVDDYKNGKAASVISLSGLEKYIPPEPEVVATEGDAEGEYAEGEEEPAEETSSAVPSDPNVVTYQKAICGTGYNLGAFLAASGSRHNLGVAIDMTLETLDGQELQMQTNMHDLSYHSVQGANNENANILKNIMEPAGFGMITSEWWHFQDNDTKNQLQPSSVANGVCVEGWKKDAKGWRYRMADGTFIENKTESINGVSYEFDTDGYTLDY